jgi:hypothetical protein
MSTKRTLELFGKKPIHIRTSMSNTRQGTMAVMITGDGTVLSLTINFKGKHDGCITLLEFATYLAGNLYCFQKAEWMDEQVMLAWVEEVLAPSVAMAPKDINSLLILDSYQCHMMASVVYKIQDLGVEVNSLTAMGAHERPLLN